MVTTVPASVPIESFQRLRIETVCRVVVFPVFDSCLTHILHFTFQYTDGM